MEIQSAPLNRGGGSEPQTRSGTALVTANKIIRKTPNPNMRLHSQPPYRNGQFTEVSLATRAAALPQLTSSLTTEY